MLPRHDKAVTHGRGGEREESNCELALPDHPRVINPVHDSTEGAVAWPLGSRISHQPLFRIVIASSIQPSRLAAIYAYASVLTVYGGLYALTTDENIFPVSP